MKKSKTSLRKSNMYKWVIIALAIVAVIAFGAVYVYKLTVDRRATINMGDQRPKVENVLTLEGKVTLVKSSCGAKSLDPQEDVKRFAICDTGRALRIGDRIVYTSSGGPGKGFGVDVSWVKLGDRVSVKYVNDATYGPSLNCSECSVTPN